MSLTLSTSKRIVDILCAIECKSENSDQKLILIAIYIKDIEILISKALFPRTPIGSQTLSELTDEPINDYNQPVIPIGDFNIHFALPEAQPLLEFFENKFNFKMINAKNDSTTKGGTNIDAIFVRNIYK